PAAIAPQIQRGLRSDPDGMPGHLPARGIAAAFSAPAVWSVVHGRNRSRGLGECDELFRSLRRCLRASGRSNFSTSDTLALPERGRGAIDAPWLADPA